MRGWSGCGSDQRGELLRFRERGSVVQDESAQGPAVAQAVERTSHQSEVDIRRGLVPGSERAGGDILLDGFGRGAQPGVFPVVDRAGAVRGQMGQPVAGHHALEDSRGAVAKQMGAVDQDDGGAGAAGGADLLGAVFDQGIEAIGAGGWDGVWVDEDLIGFGQAVALGKGEDFQFAEVERLGYHEEFLPGRWRMKAVFHSAAEQVIDEGDGVAKIGDDGVGADALAGAGASIHRRGPSRCLLRRWRRPRRVRRIAWCFRSRRNRRRKKASVDR